MLKSIRWRLPLNILGVTGLTVVLLGIVLMAILRAYYARLEREHLRGASNLLPSNLIELLADEGSQIPLQGYLENIAFLSQTRVQVKDADGKLQVDTGSPVGYTLTLGMLGDGASPALSGERLTYQPFMIVGRAETLPTRVVRETLTDSGERVLEVTVPRELGPSEAVRSEYVFGQFPVNVSAFGYTIGGEPSASTRRSSQTHEIEIHDPRGLLATIEFSEGPAYGSEIANSVMLGFLFAGGLSFVLAGAVGWWISRRMSDPLTELTQSTALMAEGDYTIRTDVRREDELGVLARSFNHMATRVEKNVAALRRFVSDAAHEIHTPLTVLRTNLELMMYEPAKKTRLGYVGQALRQVERLEGMTNSLLDLSRLESGEFEGDLETVNFSDLLREESERYASEAEQRGISFSLDLPEDDLEVLGRPVQLRSVVGNLLDNAVKFTPEGGSIWAGLRPREDIIELWVEDTGIGVPEEDIPNLFQRFYRAHNASSHPGSGLGLAIVKSIVEAHGGFVLAEGKETGTRFVVNLPAEDSLRSPLGTVEEGDQEGLPY